MPQKLIEVALPLEEINREAAREKSIRHGHPSTLHLWWARRPLAAARAVLFAQLVDDPSSHPDQFPTEAAQNEAREELFKIIRRLVQWENINNEQVLAEARAEIAKYAPPEGLPPFLDPFAGGGSIPLEAQRLGLEAHASDLNPVAVLINKALIEIPPQFANRSPVSSATHLKGGESATHLKGASHLGASQLTASWRGASGLAADVRQYGAWMRQQAEARIGHLYPTVTLPHEHGGGEATVIAWLWARTVPSPHPAAKGEPVPLVRSFALSTKKGKEAWVEPVVAEDGLSYQFVVRTGKGAPAEGTVNRKGGVCLLTNAPIPFEYIRAEGRAGRMGARLMAIVAEGKNGRVYLAPDAEHERIAQSAQPQNVPDTDLPKQALGFRIQAYGMVKHRDLFTDRQLVALTTFSDLVGEARGLVVADALAAGWAEAEAERYGTAVATYLGLAVSKLTDYNSRISNGANLVTKQKPHFSRQALPMVWDFVEVNPFCSGRW
jgi:putative DNA methylase